MATRAKRTLPPRAVPAPPMAVPVTFTPSMLDHGPRSWAATGASESSTPRHPDDENQPEADSKAVAVLPMVVPKDPTLLVETLMANPSVKFDDKLISDLRSIFPPGKTYRFRMTGAVGGIITDGSGNLAQNVSWDPATTTYNEWSCLSALFDEVVLQSAQLRCLTFLNATSGNINVAHVGAPVFNVSNTTPPNVASVVRLPNAQYFTAYTSTGKPTVTLKAHVPEGTRPYGSTGASAPTSPPAGMCGAFWIVNTASGTPNQQYFTIFLDVIAKFRFRA